MKSENFRYLPVAEQHHAVVRNNTVLPDGRLDENIQGS